MKKLEEKKAYPKYRRLHLVASRIFWASCALVVLSFVLSLFLGRDNTVTTVLAYVAIAGVVVFYLMNFLFWRCPDCHKPMPLFGPVPICRYCKRAFMDKNGEYHW